MTYQHKHKEWEDSRNSSESEDSAWLQINQEEEKLQNVESTGQISKIRKKYGNLAFST